MDLAASRSAASVLSFSACGHSGAAEWNAAIISDVGCTCDSSACVMWACRGSIRRWNKKARRLMRRHKTVSDLMFWFWCPWCKRAMMSVIHYLSDTIWRVKRTLPGPPDLWQTLTRHQSVSIGERLSVHLVSSQLSSPSSPPSLLHLHQLLLFLFSSEFPQSFTLFHF